MAASIGGVDRVRRRAGQFMVMLLVALWLSACGPEAARTQGGGPGGDTGNRPASGAEVDMHGEVNPAFDTPAQGQAIQVSQP